MSSAILQNKIDASLLFEDSEISNREVHVWYGSGDDLLADLSQMTGMLSETERMRAEKYHFEIDRNRFFLRHGILRALIGRYRSTDPKDIQLNTNPYGKPSIGADHNGNSLEFNLSHSEGMMLFAFACGRRIGVDIEFMRPIDDMNAIVEHHFSANEKGTFKALAENKRLEAFYRGWTQKEAFLKARGDGLSLGLDQFDVSMAPDTPASLKRTAWDPAEAGQWSLTFLHLVPGYSMTLAVEGDVRTIHCRQLLASPPVISGVGEFIPRPVL